MININSRCDVDDTSVTNLETVKRDKGEANLLENYESLTELNKFKRTKIQIDTIPPLQSLSETNPSSFVKKNLTLPVILNTNIHQNMNLSPSLNANKNYDQRLATNLNSRNKQPPPNSLFWKPTGTSTNLRLRYKERN